MSSFPFLIQYVLSIRVEILIYHGNLTNEIFLYYNAILHVYFPFFFYKSLTIYSTVTRDKIRRNFFFSSGHINRIEFDLTHFFSLYSQHLLLLSTIFFQAYHSEEVYITKLDVCIHTHSRAHAYIHTYAHMITSRVHI